MLRTLSRLSLILPALIILASVGLFVAIQVRMILHDDLIYEIVNDTVPEQAFSLQKDVWELKQAVDSYAHAAPEMRSEVEIATKYEALKKAYVDMEAYFMTNEQEALEHKAEMNLLHASEEDFRSLQSFLPPTAPLCDQALREVSRDISKIMGSVYVFSSQTHETHQSAVNDILTRMAHEEIYRNVLAFLVLIFGLLLFVVLARAASSFRRNAEVAWAMERYNALFGAALQSVHVGVLIRDMQKLERPVVFVNKAFTDLTGYEFEAIKDKKSDVLFGWHTNPAAIELFHDAIRSEKAATVNILVYRKDGSSFWSEWHISPVVNKTGVLTHFVSLITDVTDLKQAQEGLMLAKEQAERASAVKTNFLATMSHEIRTPINGLLGVLDLLGDTPLSEDQKKYIDIALTSGKALHAIINDILDYAKMEAGKVDLVVEPFSLRELLQDALDISTPVSQRKGIQLVLDVQESVPDGLVSDMGRIRQIILNLLSNAVKFTDKGSVTLRVLHLLTQETGDEAVALLRFEVQDTGIGISAVDQDKLFKEFSQVERTYTRRFGGTGLGLAITRRLVEMMNGEIGVSSKPGQGSTFWFMLPLPVMKGDVVLPRSDGRLHAMELLDAAKRSDKAILLVEDNETNRLVAMRYLEKAGFKPDIATSGAEAVRMAKQKFYDLILMDISMAEMDGLQATRHIREESPRGAEVPIVALTAHVMPGDSERFLASGMNDCLSKPIDYTALVHALVRWLKLAPESTSALGGVLGVAPSRSAQVSMPSLQAAFVSEKPDFDPEVLRRLAEDLGPEVVWRVTGVFIEDSEKRIKPLLEKHTTLPLDQLRDVAHTLKSSSASCGAMRFSVLMAAMEEAASRGDSAAFAALLPDVGPTYAASCAAMLEGRKIYQPSQNQD